MATIVEPAKGKRVTCSSCKAVMEYMPEEIERHDGTDYTGGADGYERVKCPRPGCPGHGYVRSW
jgi:hypothetical protein